jgi:membrane protein required for colicin V production
VKVGLRRSRFAANSVRPNSQAEHSMPITWLDLLLFGVMLISGLLAMIRGFIREILSITAWLVAAAAAYLAFRDGRLLTLAKANISSDIIATAAVVGGVFLIALLVVSVITVRVSDLILDSRIGALDRTLGFLFGLGRGLIIVVVSFLFFNWLVPPAKQPDGVRNAKSLRAIELTGNWLQDLLPQDLDNYISQVFRKRPRGGEEQEPPDSPPPEQKSDRNEPTTTGSVRPGYQKSDRTDMRQLIDATRR